MDAFKLVLLFLWVAGFLVGLGAGLWIGAR